MSDRYSGAHLLIAFLAGAAAGAVATVLTAPQSGPEARDKLRGWAKGTGGTATRVPHALRAAYDKASHVAKEAFTEALHEQIEESAAEE